MQKLYITTVLMPCTQGPIEFRKNSLGPMVWILLLGYFLSLNPLCAQVFNGFKEVYTQQDVNDLGADGYSSITQGLYIRNSTDITDLTPLSSLTSVGALFIGDNEILTDLTGLHNITTITGAPGEGLYIARNTNLSNLNGLGGLRQIAERLIVENNPSLQSLSGLAITSVVQLAIFQNASLVALSGLENLTSVTNDLSLTSNLSLTDLSALNSLNSAAAISIHDNNSLLEINGFANLSVTGPVRISDNSLLNNFCGLTPWAVANPTFSDFMTTTNAYNPTFQQVINACNGVAPPMTAIPDQAFERYLIDAGYDTDATVNGTVLTSDISGLAALTINGYDIAVFTGLQDFLSLTEFEMIDNQASAIQEIDFSNTTALTTISVINAPNLPSVNIIQNNNLVDLSIVTRGTIFNAINLTGKSSLRVLQLADNAIAELDLSGVPNLTYLGVALNPITEVNLSDLTDLESFDFYDSEIFNIDVSSNTNLRSVDGRNAVLRAANLKNGANAGLTSVDLSGFGNTQLECIQVDDITYADQQVAAGNWAKESFAIFSTNCGVSTCGPTFLDPAFEAFLEDPNNSFVDAAGNPVFPSDAIPNNNTVCFNEVIRIAELILDGEAITDFTALGDFSGLRRFTLRAAPAGLVSLNLSNNLLLEEVDISETSLENLSLPTNTNTLQKLTLSMNNFSGEIDVSGNTALTEVQAVLSSFGGLNTSGCTALQILNFDTGVITALDLSTNANLQSLNLDTCPISTLELTSGSFPNLNSIVVTRSAITNLTIRNTVITSINLNEMANLQQVNIEENPLLNSVFLNDPGSSPFIERLSLRENDLTGELQISNVPGITTLDVSGNVNLTTLDITNQENLEFLSTFRSGILALDLSTNNGSLSEANLGTPAGTSSLSSLNLKNSDPAFVYADFILATDNNPSLSCIAVNTVFDAVEAVNQGAWSVQNVPDIFKVDCNAVTTFQADFTLVGDAQNSATITEGNSSVEIQISIPGADTENLIAEFDIEVVGVTATAGNDFTAIPVNEKMVYEYYNDGLTFYTVDIRDDAIFENTENFIIRISNPSNPNIVLVGADSNGVLELPVSIEDDEFPLVDLSALQGQEGGADVRLQVDLVDGNGDLITSNVNEELSFDIQLNDGTAIAGSDYQDFQGGTATVVVAPFENAGFLEVSLIDDTISEPTETFTATLSKSANTPFNDRVFLNTTEATATILDNDSTNGNSFNATAEIVINGTPTTIANEGTVAVAISMTIPNSDTANLLVDFDLAVEGTTAIKGTDFTDVGTTESISYEYFNDGLELYTIAIFEDELLEGEEEFVIRISNPSDARVNLVGADANGFLEFTIRIVDNETAFAYLTSTDGVEGGNASFTVTLRDGNNNPINNNTGSDIDFDIQLTDGTAVSPEDYTAFAANTKITVGNTAVGGFLDVFLVDDALNEGQEQFTATITNPSLASIAITQANATVRIAPSDNPGGDSDGDGIMDAQDNCINTPNADQSDLDNDAVGDVCDSDIDGDGIDNIVDTCPEVPGVASNFGCPDDGDLDDDGVPDTMDNCINIVNPDQLDSNGDGIGDACDGPIGNDLVLNPGDLEIIVKGESCPNVPNGYILVLANVDYEFTATVTSTLLTADQRGDFNDSTAYLLNDLAAGQYIICITATAFPEFEQCFGVTILNSENISVTSQALDVATKRASYNVQGSTSYSASVNGKSFSYEFDTTETKQIEVLLDAGKNKIQITGENECQGLFEEELFVGQITAYPNPVVDKLQISGLPDGTFTIFITGLDGTAVHRSAPTIMNGSISLNVADLSSGLYVVYIQNAQTKQEFKIIKK